MAEILIQRKRRRRPWFWLLGLVVLALLPWPFLGNRGDTGAPATVARRDTVSRRDTTAPADTTTRRDTTPAAPVTAIGAGDTAGTRRTTATASGAIAPADTSPPAAATSFTRFIAAPSPASDARAHRRYTANALRRLADALDTLGASKAGLSAIRVNAESLLTTARVNARPDYARAAFLAAVHEFDVLGARAHVPVDTARLRAAAWAIKPDQGLLTQRRRIQTFFERASDALHTLSRRRR